MIYDTFFNNAKSITLKSTYFLEVFKNSEALDCTAISIDNKETITIGDKVPVTIQASLNTPYNTYYIANKIYPESRSAIITEFEENDTTLFILPMLGIDLRLLSIKPNFINGYIATDTNYNELGDCVYIVYRYMPFGQYKNVMKILAEQKEFISCEKAKDKRFDIVKLAIPDKYKDSVKLIFEGKYSEIPKYLKHIIIKASNRSKDDIIHQTLFNSLELKEKLANDLGIRILDLPTELRSKPNKIKEIWQN